MSINLPSSSFSKFAWFLSRFRRASRDPINSMFFRPAGQ